MSKLHDICDTVKEHGLFRDLHCFNFKNEILRQMLKKLRKYSLKEAEISIFRYHTFIIMRERPLDWNRKMNRSEWVRGLWTWNWTCEPQKLWPLPYWKICIFWIIGTDWKSCLNQSGENENDYNLAKKFLGLIKMY